MDQLTEFYPIRQVPQPIVRDMFGCSLYPTLGVNPLSFSPFFGNSVQLQGTATPSLSLTLPASLSGAIGQTSPPSLAFCGYRGESLFVRRESYLVASGRSTLLVASNVVSARLSGGVKVSALQDPVKMSFNKNKVGCDVYNKFGWQ